MKSRDLVHLRVLSRKRFLSGLLLMAAAYWFLIPSRLGRAQDDAPPPRGETATAGAPKFYAFCMETHDARRRSLPEQAAMLLAAERFDAVAAWLGAKSQAEELDKAWKNLLTAQSHDVGLCE